MEKKTEEASWHTTIHAVWIAFTEFTVVSKNVNIYWEAWKYFEIQEAHATGTFRHEFPMLR